MENPAYKLNILLNKAFSKATSNSKFRDTWSSVFEIDVNDTVGLLKSYSIVINLFSETKKLIKQNEKLNNERNLRYLDRIEKAISKLDIDGYMLHFTQWLNNETLVAFSYISEAITEKYSFDENTIDDTSINNLINDVHNLINNVLESNLPSNVKSLLLKNLTLINESLQNYKISGYEGVEDAFHQTFGSIFMNNQTLLPVTQDENVKGFFKVMDKINSLLSTGVSLKELLAPIFNLLLK